MTTGFRTYLQQRRRVLIRNKLPISKKTHPFVYFGFRGTTSAHICNQLLKRMSYPINHIFRHIPRCFFKQSHLEFPAATGDNWVKRVDAVFSLMFSPSIPEKDICLKRQLLFALSNGELWHLSVCTIGQFKFRKRFEISHNFFTIFVA